MAATPVFAGNSYVETGDRTYQEIQVKKRNEFNNTLTTDGYAVGSEATCTEDWSIWKVGYDDNDALVWLEVEV